ncbi:MULTISPECIES: ABC transporter permease subunit [unclassified Flavonifractor]|uniref:ABC transporter permease subunit n=1 Tax=unclassified Flavonifractor TaxID=2629267 RepID=UPI000B3AAFA7|nr:MULTISPECIES: galactoside ABC transporter permease [unclassified Flavonifractor]OUN09538.1 galactoside ABC transporter permease [Flavonifractor sp. An9]OUQ60941.1 galactoside ABC transporter permease [Flavonifractor sp. An112]
MVANNSKILTAEQEEKLRQPIDEYVGKIQAQIDALRADGTDKVIDIQNSIDSLKRDKIYTAQEKAAKLKEYQAELAKAKEVEAKNKEQVSKLIGDAEAYLKAHFDTDYYQAVTASCKEEKQQALTNYAAAVDQLNKEHQATLSKLSDPHEIKDEKYVHKNRLFDAKMKRTKDLQEVKDRRHAAFDHKFHLIDMLRMSKFTFGETMSQKWENYKYTFNRRDFLLRNGLYIAIIIIFIALCIATPIIKNVQLLTVNNVLNILSQASPRMFLALGVAGLILLAGTDLSIGRMVGMGMTAATIVMHSGPNTGGVFGYLFDFSGIPVIVRVFLALVVCIVLCTIFTTIAGFFTAKFKMHPFISTMATMLVIFGLVTYSTKGVSFGGIDSTIPGMVIPRINGFPTIILWAVAAVAVVWFIWNKTTFGKNLFAVGGNPEAAAVSGISVFKVTVGAFILAGVLYGFGSWLECLRMTGSGSAAYGQGWEMDAIAACVVGGISFTGGIGKISGCVVGVFIFTALTYSLTTLGIDTNLQFVFSGIIILVAVMLDCLKYVQKK